LKLYFYFIFIIFKICLFIFIFIFIFIFVYYYLLFFFYILKEDGITDEECIKRYELGRSIIGIIKCYEDRLDDYFKNNINELKSKIDYEDKKSEYSVNNHFIGNYICVKNYKSEEDVYIDLEVGDIVSIEEFCGEYAVGYNYVTEKYGLFPIYNIDSLNGFIIFYRVLEDFEYADKNDVIFIISETENEQVLGYNITKEYRGFFSMDLLEVLQFDNDNNPIFEDSLMYNMNSYAVPDSFTMDANNNNNSLNLESGFELSLYKESLFDDDDDDDNDNLLIDDNKERGDSSLFLENIKMATRNITNTNRKNYRKVVATGPNNVKKIIEHFIKKETEFNEILNSSINILIAELEKHADIKDEILNKVDISILFKYFPELYHFSTELLDNLKNCLTHYDEFGMESICKLFGNENFDYSPFVKYAENYEYSLDAYDRIKKDAAKYERVENILKHHKKEFHRLYLKDLLCKPITHFPIYRLFLEEIQKKVLKGDIYNKLEIEIIHLKTIGNQMNKKVEESIQIHKFFNLKKIVLGFPDDFISSKRKLITDFEVMGNARGNFFKQVYLFNDAVMVVSTNKEAKKKGYQYILEKIMFFKDYDFEKVYLGNKIRVKCKCKNNDLNKFDGDSYSLFKRFKGRRPNYDDQTIYLYFKDLATCSLLFQQYKKQNHTSVLDKWSLKEIIDLCDNYLNQNIESNSKVRNMNKGKASANEDYV